MKVSFTCMNSYYSPEAMKQNFTATPRSLWDPEFGKKTATYALEQAALADSLGFDFVSVSEHHYQAGMPNPNPAVLAAALTQVVDRAGIALLGPLVSMNNPVRLAEEIAMLDQISQGRLIVLPLRGTPNEFANYNVPADETRGRTEEGMLLIKKALTELEPFAWKGEYFDFPIVSVWPGPTQVPHPPLYGSANSDESIAFIAKHQFGAGMSYFGPKAVAAGMQKYKETCAQHGWEPTEDQMLFRAFCVIGETPAEAEDLKSRFMGPVEPEAESSAPAEGAPKLTSTDSMAPEDLAGFGFGLLQFTGDADSVVEQLNEFHELTGVGIIDLSFNFGHFTHEETMRQLKLFGELVLPRLRQSVPATV